MTADPMVSVVDYMRDEARTEHATSSDFDWPEMTRAEAEREAAEAFFGQVDATPWRPNPAQQRRVA